MIKQWFVAISLAALFVGCIHLPEVSPTSPQDKACAGQAPSFKADIQPILKSSCAKTGCHDGNSMPYDFSMYAQLRPVLDDSEVYYYVIVDKKMP